MTTTVWTERRTTTPWDQCSECGYLMGLVHGGFRAFPAGIYTNAERDALTAAEKDRDAWRAAGKPMFDIIDPASKSRYGVRLRTVSGTTGRATAAQMVSALSTPGNAVVLPGTYGNLPVDHPLRKWQPSYRGGHMVAAIVQPNATILWLDPLAPMGYAGDLTDLKTAMRFAYTDSDAHVVAAGEFLEEDDLNQYLKGHDPVINRRASIGGGATVRTSPKFNPKDYNENRMFVVPDRGSNAPAERWVDGTNLTLSNGSVFDARTEWLAIRGKDYGLGFIHIRDVQALDAIESGDCSAEVAAAVAPLNRKIRHARSAVGAAQTAHDAEGAALTEATDALK